MKKFFCFFLALTILQSSLTSCGTSKTLSVSEATQTNNKSSLILHTGAKIYTLENYAFLEDKLTGNLKQYKKPKGNTLHVYTDIDYGLKLKDHQSHYVELSNQNIKQIMLKNKKAGKTVLFITGGLVVSFIVLALIAPPYSI